MLRTVITGATAVATLLTPTDAGAATVYAAQARVCFAGTVQSAAAGSLVVSIRSGRRDGRPTTVTVLAASAAAIRLNGRAVTIGHIPPAARVSVRGGTTAPGTVLATDITATR